MTSDDREFPTSMTLPPGTRVEPGQHPAVYYNVSRPASETQPRHLVEVTVGRGAGPFEGADYGVPLDPRRFPTVRDAKELHVLYDEAATEGVPAERMWARVAVVGTAAPHRIDRKEHRFTLTVTAGEIDYVRRTRHR